MNYYKILEINENASIYEIKNAYKKLIKKYHPDKNNNINTSDKFIEIQEAYKKLIQKKNGNRYFNIFYDLYNDGIFDKYVNLLYNKFVYNIKSNNIIYINCHLEEFYRSCIKTIKFKRKIATSSINYVIEEKILNLNVNSLNYDKQKIIYNNFGDKINYNDKNNDLIVILQEIEHELFERNEFDLIIKIDISLKEALCSNTIIKIPLLNDTYYNFEINKIIKPNHVEIIKGLGMPKPENKYGNLILKFNIIFPDSLNENQKKKLKVIL